MSRKRHRKEPPKPHTPILAPDVLHLFTDGSCILKTKQGGWGVVLRWNEHTRHLYGGAAGQTNNTMEMQAVLEALQARKKDVRTIVYTDSQYTLNSVTRWHHGWRRRGWITSTGQPVKNVELIEAITKLITPNVSFLWVRGHNGHTYNETADRLATQGRKEYGTCKQMQRKTLDFSSKE